jgi:N4-gp56 family major capsid protein
MGKMRKAGIETFSDGSFHLILTTEQSIGLQADTSKGGWMEANQYAGRLNLLTGEVGMFAGFRIIDANKYGSVSTAGGSASADVHVGWAFGPGAIMQGDLQTVSTHYVAPGGQGDPLAQRMYVGWKWTGGFMLISEAGEHCYRLETAQTTY